MTLYVIFAVLILIASVLLVGVVLIQKSKGGGLAANVSGYNQFVGVKRTTEFVEKATWGLAIFICVLSIASAFVQAPTIVQGAPQIKKLPTTETQAPTFGTQTEGTEQAAPAQQGEKAAAPAQQGEKAAAPAQQAPAQPAPAAPAAPAK